MKDKFEKIAEAIAEWESSKRKMGCVAATQFLVSRVPGFSAKRITRYTKDGDLYQHVVATDGVIVIDLAPYADRPDELDEGHIRLFR